jgi:hypothetical protein
MPVASGEQAGCWWAAARHCSAHRRSGKTSTTSCSSRKGAWGQQPAAPAPRPGCQAAAGQNATCDARSGSLERACSAARCSISARWPSDCQVGWASTPNPTTPAPRPRPPRRAPVGGEDSAGVQRHGGAQHALVVALGRVQVALQLAGVLQGWGWGWGWGGSGGGRGRVFGLAEGRQGRQELYATNRHVALASPRLPPAAPCHPPGAAPPRCPPPGWR